MSIPSISEVAPISLFSTALASTTSNGSQAGTTAKTSAATSTSTSTPVAVAAPAVASAAVTTPAATASFSTASSTESSGTSPSLVSELESSVTYSTTVGGRNYFGSVSPYDGQYQATVNELPGANATGASVDLAETNLNNLISFLV